MKKLLVVFALAVLVLLSAASAAECAECADKVCVFYFYRPDCSHCQKTSPYINSWQENYSGKITFHKFNTDEFEGYTAYNKLCNLQNIPLEDRRIPLAVVGNKFFMGDTSIINNLESEIIIAIENNKTGCPFPDICLTNQTVDEGGHQPIVNVSQVTLPLITAAAVADSVNPCAIGVLIFLLGFLLVSSGGSKKRTALISAIYILTVYIIYLLAGFGILSIMAKLSFLKILTKVFAGIIVLFGIINIKDSFKEGKAMLAIPDGAKPLIHRWVYKASIPAAIVLGFIVASVELPCTGGMYIAILALLANAATKTSAFWYLIYYNLIFVLPLILITLLFIFGLEAEKMQEYLEKHKRKARFLIGMVLLIIGAVLLFL